MNWFRKWLEDNHITIDLLKEFHEIGVRNLHDLTLVVNDYRHLLDDLPILDRIKIINFISNGCDDDDE
jgi:hypothetical protein